MFRAYHYTSHFAIEWCSDSSSVEYPDDGLKHGLDYVQFLGRSLERAWDTYERLGYNMPLPTPGRSDGRILVHVQAAFDLCGWGITFEDLGIGSGGFAFDGQIWIPNNSSPTDNCVTTPYGVIEINTLGFSSSGISLKLTAEKIQQNNPATTPPGYCS